MREIYRGYKTREIQDARTILRNFGTQPVNNGLGIYANNVNGPAFSHAYLATARARPCFPLISGTEMRQDDGKYSCCQ
jgi:hypothetical protein